ncbi:hypothetical protein [Plantactinospora sp. WMMB782]|uniref:hypothetical protein n=1 Tax=Plantactinospora sp. WMMB782 TaxID=3404121 RepID=UPI003B9371FD
MARERKRNPRRIADEVIKAIKNNATDMHRIWDGPGYVTEERDGRSRLIQATGDQRPENQPERWDQLAQFMEVIERQARNVREFAERMAERVRAGERF